MLKFRKLLYPFSVLYDGVTAMRNLLYDKGILRSDNYDIPVIAVGNLNTGGTGKSPMIEYLLRLLLRDYKVATLSRGYKRESSGFILLREDDEAQKVGDEPLQFKRKFPKAAVAVDANRRAGIIQLLKEDPDVILLDDAFQHRKVVAGFYILLTAYGDLYANDLLLPAGNLRESFSGAKRADAIIVTKCPENLSDSEMDRIKDELNPSNHQQVYFTGIKYSGTIKSSKDQLDLHKVSSEKFTLVTGIANPEPLLRYLSGLGINMEHQKYPDHHNFTKEEITALDKKERILTTEKDYMRLKDRITKADLFYLPIEVYFLKNPEGFIKTITDFIKTK